MNLDTCDLPYITHNNNAREGTNIVDNAEGDPTGSLFSRLSTHEYAFTSFKYKWRYMYAIFKVSVLGIVLFCSSRMHHLTSVSGWRE